MFHFSLNTARKSVEIYPRIINLRTCFATLAVEGLICRRIIYIMIRSGSSNFSPKLNVFLITIIKMIRLRGEVSAPCDLFSKHKEVQLMFGDL